jgi:cytochrome c-type biogenesis protein CcmF
MNGALGMAGIALGLAASILGGITLVLGVVQHHGRLVRSGTIYVWLVLAGAVLSVAAMERALITRDFSLTFVADNGSAATPALYNVASLWSALQGSILLWTIILAGYLAATFLWFRRRVQDPLVTWALVVLVHDLGLLLPPAGRSGQSLRAGERRSSRRAVLARTRSSRTTR